MLGPRSHASCEQAKQRTIWKRRPPSSRNGNPSSKAARCSAFGKCLVASELDAPVEDLKAVFGIETCHHDPAVEKYGLTNALLPVGSNFLEVVAPFRNETAAGRYIDRRGGDGGYMVILQCDDAEDRAKRMPDIGVWIANRLNYGTYIGLQLHPKDTGGAILETSTDPRSILPDGSGIRPARTGRLRSERM